MKLRNGLLLLSLTLLASCLGQKNTVNKTSGTSSTSGTGTYQGDTHTYTYTETQTVVDSGTGHGDGNEDGVADGGQTQDYISINNIVTHGTAGQNRFYPGGGPLWSSAIDLSSSNQGIFYTNSRFNVRVRAQAGPGQNTADSKGNNCQYVANNYTKLDIDICVRKPSGSCIYTQNFEQVPVGQVSKVKQFSIPTTSDPLVIEVLGVKWDYSCISYLQQGVTPPSGYCPMGLVWDTSCVKFDIQFSTDYTKDFPSSAPRY